MTKLNDDDKITRIGGSLSVNFILMSRGQEAPPDGEYGPGGKGAGQQHGGLLQAPGQVAPAHQ
jgi:hypothetical protein